uniref:Uncharacterized protein n=1 Tax=Cacopsylla melanoneura TaxID=428564 RepID=A0A8D9F4V7_9HEMI
METTLSFPCSGESFASVVLLLSPIPRSLLSRTSLVGVKMMSLFIVFSSFTGEFSSFTGVFSSFAGFASSLHDVYLVFLLSITLSAESFISESAVFFVSI